MSEPHLAKARYVIRTDLAPKVSGSVRCPLGVFPCEANARLEEGFEARYSTAEDEFGDQYEFRVLVSSERLFAIMRSLLRDFLPAEAYGLYEEISLDAFRDTDAWMSDDLVGRERLRTAWETYGRFIVEDGRCGFGILSYDPPVEIFVEEHGALYIATGLELKPRIEEFLAGLDLGERESMKFIENFRHQHRDILNCDRLDGAVMTEHDIKFSIVESLGMKPTNQQEGEPDVVPSPFWVHVELDLSFADVGAQGAFMSFGVTADDHEQAVERVSQRIVEMIPAAMISRVVECHRLADRDIDGDIAPDDRQLIEQSGIWHETMAKYWK